VLRPHRRVVHAYFRIDDPGPMVARMLTIAQKAASRSGIRGGARAEAVGPTGG
jgi:hypothetical protein